MARGVRVETKPEVIKYYIDKSELNVESLSQNNQLKLLKEWIDGDKNPTLKQLNQLSKKLEIPLGYLIVNEPIDDTPDLLNYRTIDSKGLEQTSRNLIETIKISKNQQEFVAEYRKNNGYSSLDYVNIFTEEDELNEIIEFSRELLDLPVEWQQDLKGLNPLKYFREKLNAIGIIVQRNGIVGGNTRRVLEINEFRAFVIIDEQAPLIFINTNDTLNGQLFSLLHEFGHILLGTSEVYNVDAALSNQNNRIETLCNSIASELLIPNDWFVKNWTPSHELDLYDYTSELARQFKVSKTVVARKALDNKFIDTNQYDAIAQQNFVEYKNSKQRKKNKNGGGDYYKTLQSKMDSTLFNTVKNDYYEGNIQYSEALKILNVGSKGFDFLANPNEGDLL